jgi:hypothetical protein
MLSAVVLSLAISACAQAPTPETAAVPPRPATDPASPSHCDAGKASAAIGQLPLAEVVEAARQAAGAEVVRTLRQGQPITKEFRVGRLNLVLDAEGRIASANCS